MRKVIVEYYKKAKFEFWVTEDSSTHISGHFSWNKDIKEKMKEIDMLIEQQNEYWYLDGNGYRLTDEALFAKSPWSIIEKGITRKVVQRSMNYHTGESMFALEPWFRIGDEYHTNKNS